MAILISVGALCLTPAVALAQSGVDVVIDQFGFGMFRSGGIVPMRVKLTSNLAEAKGIWVQWQVPNADGDVGEYGRSLTLSPGQTNFTWLYAPIAPNENASSVWTVRVFEEVDGERRGELGGLRFSPSMANAQQADLASGMLAVVGDRRLSLDDYSAIGAFRIPRPISGHEDTRVASGLKPTQFPDRWYGLSPFEAIAWAGDNVPPQDLTIDQADAIREYVQRGGNLIIALPAAGNPWGLGAIGQTQLEDMLPCRTNGVTPRRDEGVPLSELLPAMCKTSDVASLIGARTEPQFAIRVFKEIVGGGAGENGFNVIDNGFEPLIALPDGRVIVVQKRVGFGRVTVVGVDISDGRLASVGLPHADVFWNRILGRRADTPTLNEIQAQDKAGALAKPMNDTDRNMGSGLLFSSGISMQTTAGVGLLMALLLFIAYWGVALASFFVLRHYKIARHSWLAFAAIAAGFTVLAWGSVGLVPKSMQVQHVTVLDHIARPPNSSGGLASTEEQYQRALSFFSLYLPRYGATKVAIAPTAENRDLLTSWTPPGENVAPFPNTDVFRVDVSRSFSTTLFPSRSTTTQLQANWMGGIEPSWGGLLRVDSNNPIRVVTNSQGDELSLAGSIINELPGTLRDAVVIWVTNTRIKNRTYAREQNDQGTVFTQPWISRTDSGLMANTGHMYGMMATFEWGNSTPLDLATLSKAPSPLSTNITGKFINPYENNNVNFAAPSSATLSTTDQRRFMLMLSMFHQLDPPEYVKFTREMASMDSSVTTFHREIARELDLSPWFTRPCIIVLGFLDSTPSPIPLRIDGADEPPSSTGLTMVRWIYPLPLDEDIAFRPTGGAEQ